MSEWIELNGIVAVSEAQVKSWEIEAKVFGVWECWQGKVWSANSEYRGRPKQSKRTTIKLLAWFDGDCLSWQREGLPALAGWHRIPSEDKSIEVVGGVVSGTDRTTSGAIGQP